MSLPRIVPWLAPTLAALALALAPGCGDDDGDPGTDTADAAATDDTAAADASDTADASEVFIPPLEKISTITFKLGGVSNNFNVGGRAFYVAGGDDAKLLKLTSNLGTRKIEINILPVEPFAVGSWSDSVFSEVGVVVCYNDGSGPAQVPGCPEGSFTHSSIAYDLTITANNGSGSRVEGTFSATLQDGAGGVVELTEGAFDLRHD